MLGKHSFKLLMKILLINSFDSKGGAAKAAIRLHEALNGLDCNNSMLVKQKETNDPRIIAETNKVKIALNYFLTKLESFFIKILFKDINNYSIGLFSSIGIVDRINAMKPDIVHLHWVHNSMISIKDITKIKAPIVWSMHDNWAISGGCHNFSFCKNHSKIHHRCNKLLNITFSRKQKALSLKENISFLSLSSWLYKLAKDSELLRHKHNFHLPNPINTEIFTPIDQNLARNKFNLPINKKLILYGALNAATDPNKGLSILIDSLKHHSNEEYELVVFGNISNSSELNINVKTHYLGQFSDDLDINLILNTGDVLVVPSIQENFSNIILEGLASSIPVVAFNVGGNVDLVDHMKNGYLVKPFDTQEFHEGIKWILNHEKPILLKENARQKVLREFDQNIVAKKYINLYNKIINFDSHNIMQ